MCFLSELVEFDFVRSRYFSVGARGVSKVTFSGFRLTSSKLKSTTYSSNSTTVSFLVAIFIESIHLCGLIRQILNSSL